MNWQTTLSCLWKKLRTIQGIVPKPPNAPTPASVATELAIKFTGRTDPALALPGYHRAELYQHETSRAKRIGEAILVPSLNGLDGPISAGEVNAALEKGNKRTAPGSRCGHNGHMDETQLCKQSNTDYTAVGGFGQHKDTR
jgi:hypothetical protein